MNPTTWELRTTHNKLGCHSRRPAAAAALRGTRPVGRAPATAETLSVTRDHTDSVDSVGKQGS